MDYISELWRDYVLKQREIQAEGNPDGQYDKFFRFQEEQSDVD